MPISIKEQFYNLRKHNHKAVAWLIDPDHVNEQDCLEIANKATEYGVDFIFVGGSLIVDGDLDLTISNIKSHCTIPVIIFPGNNNHISKYADAILMLNMISGRNADLLIGQHVIAAPSLKKSGLEVLSTSYILVDGGTSTTVSYISDTNPIPSNKPEIAACTALAGEMIGHSLAYLDAGSGALIQVSGEMISAVRSQVQLPVIVGGGIRSAEDAKAKCEAGAEIVVIGNGAQGDYSLIKEVCSEVHSLNLEVN